jgi:ABC-type Co2+ transport system permease subunit
MVFGSIVTAIISILIAMLTWKIKRLSIRFVIMTIGTYLTAYTILWLPVWLHNKDTFELDSWANLIIHTWFLVGIVSGVVTIIITHIIKKDDNKKT